MGLLDRFNRIFNQSGEVGSRGRIGPKLLVLLVVGIALLLFNSLFSFGKREASPAGRESPVQADIAGDGEQVLPELTAVLNQIRGVSNVRIFLTMETSGRLELVADQEKTMRQTSEGDSGGGSREITEETWRETHVILRDAQGSETPLVIQEKKPLYRGVLVVADGVGDPAVKARVVEALRAVLGLPYHRITVLPRN